MGELRYGSTILYFGTRCEVNGQLHALVAITPQSRSGHCGEDKNLALLGIQLVARHNSN
jgi:hypothetical protein